MALLSRRVAKRSSPSGREYALSRQNIPLVSGLAVTESGSSIGGRTFSQIQLTFKVPTDRPDWSAARVWVKSYRANKNFVQMGEGRVSPIVILLEPSSETLTIAVQSELLDGSKSDVERSPTVAIVNDGA